MTETDLDVSQPTTAAVATARDLSCDLDQAARQVEAISTRFSDDNGQVVRGAREEMALARNAFDTEAMRFAQIAAALADLRSAGDAWLRDAPKAADIEAARTAVDAARAAMQAAAQADRPTAVAVERLRTAERHLAELRYRREQADGDYERACQRAESKLSGGGKCKPPGRGRTYEDGDRKPTAPGTPAPSPSPMPGRTPPPTRIAATTAPAPPTVSASTVPAMPTVPANAAVPAPMAPAAMQAPMPAMPQVPSTAPASAPRRDQDRPAFDSPDLAGLLAAGTAPPATTPRPPAAVAAPVAAPAPAPVATNPGFSANNLSTVAELSGRPAPGAFAAPTGLSASHAVQQMHGAAGAEAATRAGTGAPMHAPMMPGMGGMPGGGAGGGSARDRDTLPRTYSPLGMESLGASTPYTIARREKRPADLRRSTRSSGSGMADKRQVSITLDSESIPAAPCQPVNQCRNSGLRTLAPQRVSQPGMSACSDTTRHMDTETTALTTAGRRLGYARVSTADQDEALQTRALTAAGIDAIFIDHGVSGAKTSRPRLDVMLAEVQRGDTIVVYSLSRLSRGMTHLIELGEKFERDGIGLVSLTESIDTTTATGRFTFRLLAALAAMERELTIERTRAGLEAARAGGRVGGRPRALTADQRRHAQLLAAGGVRADDIAQSLGVSRATVYRALGEVA